MKRRRAASTGGGLLLCVACLLTWPPASAHAQRILVDQGVRAAGLWCFPLAGDTSEYVYLPGHARLATDERGRPRFSLITYSPGSGTIDAGASSSAAGAIVHFLVEYGESDATTGAAQDALRDLVGHHARLRGPIVFDEGRYTLVSSVLNPDRSVVASGRAPVLEGNQLAFSFYLDPVRASLLSGSLTTATPDVSVVFDMTFSGLRDAYDAELVIDWSEVHKTVQATAGGSVFFIGADVDVMVGELQRTSAIVLRSAGEDATMERLVTSAYEKAVELLFRPIEIDDVPEAEQGNLLDALAALASPEGLSRAARAITGFGLYGGFRLRDIKTSGSSVLTFSHSAAVDRHATIVFNIGDLHRRWGGDPDLFRHLRDDPAFRRREITLTVDGALVPELESYINGVTVTMRKRHDSGRETVDEVFLSRARLASDTGEVRLSYGWDDTSWAGWSQYEYRLSWSFRDGGTHTTDWIRTDNPAINLYTPYERRSIELLGDLSTLTERGVQAVAVEIEYLFFGRPLRESVLLRPTEEADDARQIDITIPRGELVYDYKITWFLTGGRRAEATGRDSSGLILVNEMPGDRP